MSVYGSRSSARTVLPGRTLARGDGPPRRQLRDDQQAPAGLRVAGWFLPEGGGTRSGRVSVISTRKAAVAWVSRTREPRPATCPCRTALAASSAVISVSVSLTRPPYGCPHESSREPLGDQPAGEAGAAGRRGERHRELGEGPGVGGVHPGVEIQLFMWPTLPVPS